MAKLDLSSIAFVKMQKELNLVHYLKSNYSPLSRIGFLHISGARTSALASVVQQAVSLFQVLVRRITDLPSASKAIVSAKAT